MFDMARKDEALLYVKEILADALAKDYTYPKMENELRINRYYLWHIINTDGYKPPNWVYRKLGIRMSHDLFAMPVKELWWALENREEI